MVSRDRDSRVEIAVTDQPRSWNAVMLPCSFPLKNNAVGIVLVLSVSYEF